MFFYRSNNYFCFFGLLLWVTGEGGAGDGSFFTLVLPPYLPAGPGSVCNGDVGLWDRGEPTIGLFTGEVLWAEGQSCWLRHTEHRGLTGRQTCCPKPTSSQLISLHSPLEQRERSFKTRVVSCFGPFRSSTQTMSPVAVVTWGATPPEISAFPRESLLVSWASQVCWRCDGRECPRLNEGGKKKSTSLWTCCYATAVFL